MASISPVRGYTRIMFADGDGKRRCLSLGKIPRREAEGIAGKVEALNRAATLGTALDEDTQRWLDKRPPDMRKKLVAVGLVAASPPLGQFLADYIAGRTDIKFNTRRNLLACKARLVEHFGTDRQLQSFTVADAKGFAVFLKGKYANATVGRTVKRARQFFAAAVDADLLHKNPFKQAEAPSQVNRTKDFFVTRDMAEAVIEACPDAEWRLLFALARFGGLRCPSELLALTWDDVDLANGRLTVRSSKKADDEDGGERVVPIFPELRPHLEDAAELAKKGAVHVIARYRTTNTNLRTQLTRIVRRAGLKLWPKVFQNLRASRVTECRERFPTHCLNEWFGHTEQVAQAHYLQVRDEDYTAALQEFPTDFVAVSRPVSRANIRTQPNATRTQQKTPQKAGFLSHASAHSCREMPPRGLEPLS
ncbi:MAG: site-specific integrase [Gemmataceae bacterium]|nr:site-specific integrase [Gemmataceae bacterium]MCI0740182.1 site-specific integrase [Gemmataceae bacterium]